MKKEPQSVKDVIISARMGTIVSALIFLFAVTWSFFGYVNGISSATKINASRIEKLEDSHGSGDLYTKNESKKDFIIRDERIENNTKDVEKLEEIIDKLNDKMDEIILKSR